MRLPKVVEDAVENLTRLPGIGERTAQRLVFWLIGRPKEQLRRLADSLIALSENVVICSECGNLSDRDPCEICTSPQRNQKIICVVQESSDMLSIERAGIFDGLYHVLGGAIDAMNDIHPEDLNIEGLISRVKRGEFEEIILATDPNSEGNITANYISQSLVDTGVKVTRLAQGISYGSGISYANDRSIKEAFVNRQVRD